MLKPIHLCGLAVVFTLAAQAQDPPQPPAGATDSKAILQRLDRLEAENRRMADEIAELKRELAHARAPEPPPAAPSGPADTDLADRMAVQETRTAELDQKKVESSQKMPLEITGMLLFNAFHNGEYAGSSLNDPVTASAAAGQRLDGATFRQTVLGLEFFGPSLPGGGKASGSVYMDFFAGSIAPANNLLHLRLATLDLAWKNTTVTVGQDKPIIAPREPTSLAQVGVSPLTGAGNLWQWQPQARIEQRWQLGATSDLRAQAGIFESNETANSVPAVYANTLGVWRPAYETRVQYGYTHGQSRFEIAPGYHAGSSRIAGQSVASRAVSLDWLARPVSRVDFTGAWFDGRNLAGLGALRQGFTILPSGAAIPVHSVGGWGQISVSATSRLSFHFFSGTEHDRAIDLTGNGISRNLAYGGNAMWKLAPNVVAAFEVMQLRTTYLISGRRLNDHYDLALAYLF